MNKLYGYLSLDLAIKTPRELKFRSNIAGEFPVREGVCRWITCLKIYITILHLSQFSGVLINYRGRLKRLTQFLDSKMSRHF